MQQPTGQFSDIDWLHLRRCVELAEQALADGDEPFGSVLTSAAGEVLAEDRNRVARSGDPTAHPELALAQWAARNVAADERAGATVYTSGEHCPMCAAAHAWVGLGRIVYVTSSSQLSTWLVEVGRPLPRVRTLPISEIAPDVPVVGPVEVLAGRVRELQLQYHAMRPS